MDLSASSRICLEAPLRTIEHEPSKLNEYD